MDYIQNNITFPDLDTDKWMESVTTLGAKYAVLVLDHFSGFNLWPSQVYNYSIAITKWKDGKGDIVADFLRSCKKYNVTPGFFYSVHENWYHGVKNFVAKNQTEFELIAIA